MAVLGLLCCAWGAGAALLCGAVASLVAEHRLRCAGFSSCGSWALEHRLSNCGTLA